MDINSLTGVVLDSCIKIHTVIGPGCFEGYMKKLCIMSWQKETFQLKGKY
jgi:hypothetical protein